MSLDSLISDSLVDHGSTFANLSQINSLVIAKTDLLSALFVTLDGKPDPHATDLSNGKHIPSDLLIYPIITIIITINYIRYRDYKWH